jgi:copper chaperone NosL
MGATDWGKPADTGFVDARKAWYVIDHPMTGAMGPTLASFKQQNAAQAFIEKHGGKLLRFEDISLEVLAKLGKGHSMH